MTHYNSYPKARVPDHLTSFTIENVSLLDKPYYISPGERDDYQPPILFVDADRQLRIVNAADIDLDDDSPSTPIGLVGIMKTVVLDSASASFKEVLIADLRFMGDHQLVDSGSMQSDAENQEEFIQWVAFMENSTVIDGFIADESGEDTDALLPKGILYGGEELHDSLKFLRRNSNKIMKRFNKNQVSSASASKKSEAEMEPKKQEVKDLSVRFSS